MSDCFFRTDNGDFVATEHTQGPWAKGFQHAGPPGALIAHAIEAEAGAMHVARLTLDLLRPIPIARLRVELTERTGGKRRRIVEARLIDRDSDQTVATALALLLRQDEVGTPALSSHDPEPPAGPTHGEDFTFDFFEDPIGYHTAMQSCLVKGGPGRGRAQMWMRPRIALIDNQAISPLQRLMLAVDSGSGVSAAVDPREYAFMNPDLTVNIRRYPVGDWVCLDATSHFQGFGLGMAETRIWDSTGVVGNATQNLLLEHR